MADSRPDTATFFPSEAEGCRTLVFDPAVAGESPRTATKKAGRVSARERAENKFVRFLLWLAFGRRKGTLAEVMAQPSPLFARNRLIAGAVAHICVIGILIKGWLLNEPEKP